MIERLAQHPWLVLAALVFTVIAGVVAVAAFGLDVFDRMGSRTAPPTTSTSSTGAGVPTASVPSPNSPAPGATTTAANSTCLDRSGQPVDCRQPHKWERYTGDCSTAGMLRFMAGRPGLDVVVSTVARDAEGCLLSMPESVAETASRALSGSGDDMWRSCLDDRENRLVTCDRPHTGEYVATGRAGKADLGECRQAAEMYMDQSLDEVGDLLQIVVVGQVDGDPNSARCLIAVRGSQPLVTSVRNLGPSPVPIER